MKIGLRLMALWLAVLFFTMSPSLAEYNVDKYAFLSSTKMNDSTIVAFGSTWVRNFTVSNVTPNPAVVELMDISSFFDIFTELSIDGGISWTPVTGTGGSLTATPSLRGVSGEVQSWSMVLSQFDITASGIMFRKSPTLPASGTNTYEPIQNGNGYQISSFFDVFTEISTDGGMTWSPVTAVSTNAGQSWTTGIAPLPIQGASDTTSWDTPVVIQTAFNLFQPRIGTGQSATVNDFHVRFRVNRWARNGNNTFLGAAMNKNYLDPTGYYGPGTVTAVDQSGDYIEITWTFPTMQISDLSMPWFGFTFGNGIYGTPYGFRYQAVEWYWTYNGVRVTQYDQTDPDVWQDWIKVWNPITCKWELQDVVVNRQTVARTVALTAGSLMNPTAPLTIASLATGGTTPPNPVLPPPTPVLPGGGGTVVTPWPWPGADPYYYMYYEVANGATPGASFRNAVVLAPSAQCPSADLSGDCFVNLDDFAILASQWLTGIQ